MAAALQSPEEDEDALSWGGGSICLSTDEENEDALSFGGGSVATLDDFSDDGAVEDLGLPEAMPVLEPGIDVHGGQIFYTAWEWQPFCGVHDHVDVMQTVQLVLEKLHFLPDPPLGYFWMCSQGAWKLDKLDEDASQEEGEKPSRTVWFSIHEPSEPEGEGDPAYESDWTALGSQPDAYDSEYEQHANGRPPLNAADVTRCQPSQHPPRLRSHVRWKRVSR